MKIINANAEEKKIILKRVKQTGLKQYLKSVEIASKEIINNNETNKIGITLGQLIRDYDEFDIPEYTILILPMNSEAYTGGEYTFDATFVHELGHLNTYIDYHLEEAITNILKNKRLIGWAWEEYACIYAYLVCLVDFPAKSYQKQIIYETFVDFVKKCGYYRGGD